MQIKKIVFLKIHQNLLMYFIIIAVNLIIFAPAVNRVFNQDQLNFFAEMQGATSFLDNMKHYDYGISRQYWKGDEITYRPLLFIWLGFQNWLFSYNHQLWNIANIIIHTATVILMFEFFLKFGSKIRAILFAILFSVMTCHISLILWNHLGGYLLSIFFMMLSIIYFSEAIKIKDIINYQKLIAGIIFITISEFFYELTMPITLLIALAVLWYCRNIKRREILKIIVLMTIPLILFGFFYSIHVLQTTQWLYIDSNNNFISKISSFFFVTVFFRWLAAIFFPSLLYFGSGGDMSVSLIYDQSWLFKLNLIIVILLLLFFFIAKFVFWKNFFVHRFGNLKSDGIICNNSIIQCVINYCKLYDDRNRIFPFAIVFFLAMIYYCWIITVGRSLTVALHTGYYRYVFSFFFILSIYIFFSKIRMPNFYELLFCTLFFVFVVIQGISTFRTTMLVHNRNAAANLYFKEIGKFIEQHKKDFHLELSTLRQILIIQYSY